MKIKTNLLIFSISLFQLSCSNFSEMTPLLGCESNEELNVICEFTNPEDWDFEVESNGDVMAIKRAHTGTDTTEVHILTPRATIKPTRCRRAPRWARPPLEQNERVGETFHGRL